MMVFDTLATLDAIAAVITLVVPAGWRVVTDPRNVNPPCVLVGVPRLDQAPCGWTGEVPVHVIAAGPGNSDARNAILPVVDLLRPALDLIDPTEPTVYYPDPSGDNGLPAYVLRVALNT